MGLRKYLPQTLLGSLSQAPASAWQHSRSGLPATSLSNHAGPTAAEAGMLHHRAAATVPASSGPERPDPATGSGQRYSAGRDGARPLQADHHELVVGGRHWIAGNADDWRLCLLLQAQHVGAFSRARELRGHCIIFQGAPLSSRSDQLFGGCNTRPLPAASRCSCLSAALCESSDESCIGMQLVLASLAAAVTVGPKLPT